MKSVLDPTSFNWATGDSAIASVNQNGVIQLKNAGTTLTITGSGADLIGNLTVSGKITEQGDVIGAGISLQNHTHTNVTSGDGTSGPPSA